MKTLCVRVLRGNDGTSLARGDDEIHTYRYRDSKLGNIKGVNARYLDLDLVPYLPHALTDCRDQD